MLGWFLNDELKRTSMIVISVKTIYGHLFVGAGKTHEKFRLDNVPPGLDLNQKYFT
jgi:hypothetical protein